LMDFHHNTSLRSIFEDDSISSKFKACIRSCSSMGAMIWLVVKPSIHSFHITHHTFTLVLHFHLGLIQPMASNLLMCECGHWLDAFDMHLTHCPFGGQRITTHDTIWDVMYVFAWESGHVVRKKWWYTITLRISLQTNIYMTWKDQVFVANVVVTYLMQEMVALNVIIQPASATTELNAIVKICKYRRLHEITILFRWPWSCMAHPGVIWIVSSKNVFIFSTIND
jgi:hypothetical protein